ncbi:MAG: tRNA uridine-5-carboxymethylaminomethyl(34) synthesis GTPase MnmE [Clostridia bacterium]|nr:tRNA uridine-5-carboxymethylaminomethyl(34) synthesis GTPase MnmE [Clostridia bacterium]
MAEQLISAISTPAGVGGVAIVRVSGQGALGLAEKMFSPTGKTAVKDFTPNYMYTGNILCDGFSDYGMCVYFKAPKSYTGEDVVEFHCHGGTEIARGVLKATLAAGARAAERGEFTKRAFINGKLSLSSAEGVIDMINAESLAEVRAGGLLYSEKLTAEIKKIQSSLTDILAGIAADTDYPEEDIDKCELATLSTDLQAICTSLDGLITAYSGGKLIKSGVSVAICGAPNVGKSSLLNALLGYDKAIVSPVAGTTRDAVEGTIIIDGVKYHLTDTAGIREQAGDIESIGIERAKRAVNTADVVVCVSDCADFSAADGVEEDRLLNVFSKVDGNRAFGGYDVAVSSLTGAGLDDLKSKLAAKATGGRSLDNAYVIEERHYSALKRARVKLAAAVAGMESFPLDIISLDIREGWRILGEITGETADEEIINTVFAKFCVGK